MAVELTAFKLRLCRVEMQDFVENDLYAVRYDRIRALLDDGTVELV